MWINTTPRTKADEKDTHLSTMNVNCVRLNTRIHISVVIENGFERAGLILIVGARHFVAILNLVGQVLLNEKTDI